VLKIVLTGPESTGKTTLAQQLAAHFHTLWLPEYARAYLSHLKRPYLPEDVVHIAQCQMQWEAVWEKQATGLLFCDTALLVPKIWMLYKYGYCDDWIETQLRSRHYDLFLLCDTDLPWEDDPLREHPEEREALFKLYQATLEAMKAPYIVLSGTVEARLVQAIAVVEKLAAKT